MNNNTAEEDRSEKLAGTLQDKHGRTREKADQKIERRLRDNDLKHIALALRARRMTKRQSIGW